MGWLLSNQILETHGCLDVEREALLAFKSGIVDPRSRLASWEGLNCCRWRGIRCNNKTGRVEKLNLRNPYGTPMDPSYMGLRGEVNSSLLSLSHLKRLDLGMNDFGTKFPLFIASFERLRYLNLSRAVFSGVIPPQLGNLSTLRYLDLSYISSNRSAAFQGKLWWIKGLFSLKYLDLTSTMLKNADDWLQAVNMLTALQVLRLGRCSLPSNPNTISYFNLTNLSILDLEYNYFNSTLPNWLWNFTSLTNLNLFSNRFYGPLPVELGNLTLLTSLILGSNNLEGLVPESIKNLCKLSTLDLYGVNIDRDITEFLSMLSCVPPTNWKILDLKSTKIRGNLSGWLEHMTNLTFLDVSNNFLNGSLPEGIRKLSNLTILKLDGNLFSGVILETHLMSFTRLKVLRVSGIGTYLHLNVDDNWVPPFQLQQLFLSSCQLGPRFPRWLRSQKEIEILDLSNNKIAEAIPNWFWGKFSSIYFLDLSNNQIGGNLPSSLNNMTFLCALNLASNRLEDSLPSLPDSMQWLDFSSNKFSGSLPRSFFKTNLLTVLLSNNSIGGNIPSSICNLQSLQMLDMSDNNIFGELPNCWNSRSKYLKVINLSNNNLSGHLPDSFGLLGSLNFLHLSNNSLHGELPSSLQYCPLVLLDLGQNKLSGKIPAWLGTLTNLTMLRLTSNVFVGNIPAELGQLKNLQILDLSWNNLTGNIPHSFGNFQGMASNKLPKYIDQAVATMEIGFITPSSFGGLVNYEVTQNGTNQKLYIVTNGLNREFSRNLFLVKSLDLSGNKLHGEIPEKIVDLLALKSLNLSINNLTGSIPSKIGNLRYLESLDLSMNDLNGPSPKVYRT
uniref:Uncharacterized protein n=1 Tax=Ananas comosus var. bracteatus TaxID=296719 RepID=A0A6V7Q8W7_ANACO|nr:unnamed protein product [Ananas comosus var. bracteatus]